MKAALLVVACAVLVGCANFPTGMGKVPPRLNIAEVFGESPNYEAVDKYSFIQAEIEYPASGGAHRIGVGDYLLAEVFDSLKGRRIEQLRLLQFSARCKPSRMFAPTALCEVSYKMVIREGESRIIESTLAPVDIGGIRVRDSGALALVSLGDAYFHKQVSPLLQAITDDMRAKLQKAL